MDIGGDMGPALTNAKPINCKQEKRGNPPEYQKGEFKELGEFLRNIERDVKIG